MLHRSHPNSGVVAATDRAVTPVLAQGAERARPGARTPAPPCFGLPFAEANPGIARRTFAVALVLALTFAVASPVAGQAARIEPAPADDSADAGFARDMADHHAQAVEMALIVLGRTEDPAVRVVATDILLTQQAQVGIMRGWMDVWDLPMSGLEPRMAWMGHPTDGPMPGMATDDEIGSLADLPPAAADRRFLELMIRHHQGGIDMARAGADLGEQPVVVRLASAILASQQNEIDAMTEMLSTMAPTEATPSPSSPTEEAGG